MQDLIPLRTVSQLLGYTDRKNRAVLRLIDSGILPAVLLPGAKGRKVRYKDVIRLIERSQYTPMSVPLDQYRDQDFLWAKGQVS